LLSIMHTGWARKVNSHLCSLVVLIVLNMQEKQWFYWYFGLGIFAFWPTVYDNRNNMTL